MSTITRELAKLFRKITNSEIDAAMAVEQAAAPQQEVK